MRADAEYPIYLKLAGFSAATHYALPIFFLIPAAVALYARLTHHFVPDRMEVMYTICLVTLPSAALAALYQRRALRFRRFATSSDNNDNYTRVMKTMHQAGWHIRLHNVNSQIVAAVPGVVTWGTRVEVRFWGSEVLANSICDPEKWPSAAGWGENADNMKLIRQAVSNI